MKKKDEWFIFIFSILLMLFVVVVTFGKLYIESADGNVYLSVADNFIDNGHFIQNAREYEQNMVVAPGLPFILTLLKLFVKHEFFVVAVQYVLFGLTNVFLFKACKNLVNTYAGYVVVIIYAFTMVGHGIHCGPSYILTETWVLFILATCIYIASLLYVEGMDNESFLKRYVSIFILLFVGFLIRPVMLMCFIPFGVYTIYLLCKKRMQWKKLFLMGGGAILVLAINVWVNYNEISEIVLLENYSAIPLYQANNPNTKTYGYYASNSEEFVDDEFWDIYDDETLTTHEKNKIYKEKTVEYIKSNVSTVIENSLEKFEIMFIDYWGKSFQIMIISMLILCIKNRKGIPIYVGGVLTMLFIALSTACGLNVWRYTITALPFYACYKAALVGIIISIVKGIKQKDEESKCVCD